MSAKVRKKDHRLAGQPPKKSIERYLFQKKTIILYRARQTGKTTLMKQIPEPYREETLFLNGDDADKRAILTNLYATKLVPVIRDSKMVLLDEALRIPETGLVIQNIFECLSRL